MENNTYDGLPRDLVPMDNQVAGHVIKNGINSVGLLKHPDGYVLKPVYKEYRGECETKFYNLVASAKVEELKFLNDFIPKFFGTVNLKINGNEIHFLKLQDVTTGLVKPCIMDVKVGAQTWDPNATAAKRAAEESKYVDSKRDFSFCIPGFQVYDLARGEFIKRGKEFGKALTKETLPNALREFLNFGSGLSHVLKHHFLNKLDAILNWFLKQREIHIYSSSILLLYDANKLEKLKDLKTDNLPEISSWIRVYMIDFAHVVPAVNGQLDHNYIDGLKKLINVLSEISTNCF